MSENATSGQEASESVDEQRAQWGRFSMTVLDGEGGSYVNVRNDSHGDDAGDHIYSVEVDGGNAVGCSCPHAVHRGAHCKHQVAVEERPIVVSSATAAGASTPRIATDGGRELEGEHPLDVRCRACSEHYTVDETVTNECPHCGMVDFEVTDDGGHDDIDEGEQPTIVDADGDEVPANTEKPDFGGGPTSGVDEL